jgi:hypothetical protein
VDRQEIHERFERIRRRAYQKIDDEWRRVMASQPPDPGTERDDTKPVSPPPPAPRRRHLPQKTKRS